MGLDDEQVLSGVESGARGALAGRISRTVAHILVRLRSGQRRPSPCYALTDAP